MTLLLATGLTLAPKPTVGNDVVDLADPAIARHHLRDRFIRRVCSPDEAARVTSARTLWSFFAAKEAAYKALVKLGHAPGFAHREIRVDPDLRSVCWRDCRLELAITGDDESVHAVAWTPFDPPPRARVAHAGEQEGQAARALVREMVAEALGCHADELVVVRDEVPGAWDGFGPPRIERAGAAVDADVSLSHDGRFAAAAMTRLRAAPLAMGLTALHGE
jgi:phosphopantetheinyl transferase (holo-ACP synthase)